MELENAQESFVMLLSQIKYDSKLKFLEWVCREYDPVTPELASGRGNEEEQDILDQIAMDLRVVLPPTAISPGEQQIFHPSKMDGMSASNTLHVDSFLYPNEEDVDSLCNQLQISRHYCLNCGAWKTAPLNFISHSISKEELKFIFQNLVPDLSGKTVVDVGSRMGPVLYGGYIYSLASKLIGIENNSFFCDLQQQVVTRYNLSDRIEVIYSDVRQQGSVLQSADLVILNNVFEFFCSLDEQAKIWEFLFHNIRKKGTLILTIPSIQESCKQLTFQNPLCLEEWVTEINSGIHHENEDLENIHLYCVIGTQ